MSQEIAEIEAESASKYAKTIGRETLDVLDTLSTDELPRLVHLTDTLAHADREFLKQMKLTLRKGVQVFEKYEGSTLNHGKEELLEIAQSLPQVLVNYYEELKPVLAK